MSINNPYIQIGIGIRHPDIGGFMSLLGKLARIYSRDCPVSKHRYVNMAGVITYLNLNFRKPVTISKLCTVAGMSGKTFR